MRRAYHRITIHSEGQCNDISVWRFWEKTYGQHLPVLKYYVWWRHVSISEMAPHGHDIIYHYLSALPLHNHPTNSRPSHSSNNALISDLSFLFGNAGRCADVNVLCQCQSFSIAVPRWRVCSLCWALWHAACNSRTTVGSLCHMQLLLETHLQRLETNYNEEHGMYFMSLTSNQLWAWLCNDKHTGLYSWFKELVRYSGRYDTASGLSLLYIW